MKVAFVGLGKMGLSLAQNLAEHEGYEIWGTDRDPEKQRGLARIGGHFYSEPAALLHGSEPVVVWLMLPAGAITDHMVKEYAALLRPGDVLIDAGNSKYTHTLANFEYCRQQEIDFLDVGTSGGMAGARHGACMMIGGEPAIYAKVAQLFTDLCVEKGALYCGPSGSGHYLKMVHNGIEYGMMQAIGEGFNLLHHSPYAYNMEDVARVFNHGSVIRSWLMELTENIYRDPANLRQAAGVIPSSGEGAWTVEEGLKRKVPLPVITQSLMTRYASEDTDKINEKVVALLRNQFGGHDFLKDE